MPASLESFAVLKGFNDDWKKRLEKNKHLIEYLQSLTKKRVLQLPELVVQLSRDMVKIKYPNLIYPVGDPVFIHIYTDERGNIKYHPIEPRLREDRDFIINEIEKRIAMAIDEKHIPKDKDEKEKVLYSILEKVVRKGSKTIVDKKKKKLILSPDDFERLKYELYCEKIGVSLLEPFIRDPYIEDISCSGLGPIYVHHKIFGTIETTVGFQSHDDLDKFVIKLSEIIGKPVSHRNPIVDATLPDGSRINIVFGEDVSRRGSNFTIRKFSGTPLSIIDLVAFGTMDPLIVAYLWMLLEEKMSIWVCGETASGKTTTLTAMTALIPPDAKIVSIEDTPEVRVPHKNWIREVVRSTEEGGSGITMFDLLKAALRQRPTYIIVGEIRGREGNIAFQAMQTGHPVLATFHAASVVRLVQRLTGYPIEVPKTYIDNLNAVIIQSAVHDPETGKYKRRVLSINEILGYDPAEGRFEFIEVFSWEPSSDSFEFRGLGSSYLLETKIAIMKGLSGREIRKVYEELDLRAKIIDLMRKLNIRNYWDVWDTIVWVHNVGLEKAYEKLRRQVMFKLGPQAIVEEPFIKGL
ncbi:MAG: type II/IV secretion system ATPase subunit [Thermoprotei archaeon]|nr:type II/IV secretion system ATPase subunit [Thermoprotei archaeon]